MASHPNRSRRRNYFVVVTTQSSSCRAVLTAAQLREFAKMSGYREVERGRKWIKGSACIEASPDDRPATYSNLDTMFADLGYYAHRSSAGDVNPRAYGGGWNFHPVTLYRAGDMVRYIYEYGPRGRIVDIDWSSHKWPDHCIATLEWSAIERAQAKFDLPDKAPLGCLRPDIDP